MAQYGSIEFSTLLGKTIVEIRVDKNDSGKIYGIEFIFDDGTAAVQTHEQDCCEDVFIEDVVGDLNDLLGAPLVMAEEVSDSHIDDDDIPESPIKYTEVDEWTFYKLATKRGYVTIRWFGTSNGYYSTQCGLWPVDADVEAHWHTVSHIKSNDVYKVKKPKGLFH
ncbi:MAG: DUF7448 domain-containing protein [Candidatus Thorarchaeota archaeon]|jgi:hypothetical protein